MSKQSPDFIYPADFEKANVHKLANRIFKGKDYSDEECQCCHRKIGEKEVDKSCSIDPKELSFMGPGVPLYFLFVRAAIILLFLMTLLYSIYSLASNAVYNDCKASPQCIEDGFNSISIVNKQNQSSSLSVQSYLGLFYIIVVIVYFHFLRAEARKLEEEVDEIVDSPSDYAIVLRRLPAKVTEEDILEMVNTRRQTLTEDEKDETDDLRVVKVILSFRLRPHLAAKAKNKAEWIKCVEEDRLNQFKAGPVPTPDEPAQIAIVIFQRQKSKDLFEYKPTIVQSLVQFFCGPCIPLSNFKVKDDYISVQRAPEPDEISWENAGITMEGAIYRRMGFGLISILTLFVGGVVQFGMAVLTRDAKGQDAKMVLRIVNPLFVVLWSEVIILVIVHLTQKQRNETVTEFQSTLLVKMTLLQFLNAGVFVILTKILASISNFDLGNGILGQVTIIMCLNVVLPNLNNFVRNFCLATRRLELFCVKQKFIIRSQLEVNKLAQGPLVNMPRRYAYVLKTLLLTALYSPMIPVVIPIGLVGVTLAYFLEKVLQTSRYGIPMNISSMTWRSSIELIEYYLITFSVGQIISFTFVHQWSLSNMPTQTVAVLFICLALAILNSALPMEFFNEMIFEVEPSERSVVRYTDIQNKFQVTYEKMNPAYRALFASKKDINPFEREVLIPVAAAKKAENALEQLFGNLNKQSNNASFNSNEVSGENLLQKMFAEKRKQERQVPDIYEISLGTNKSIPEPSTKHEICEISLVTHKTDKFQSKQSIPQNPSQQYAQKTNQQSYSQLGSFANLINELSHNEIIVDVPLESKHNIKPDEDE